MKIKYKKTVELFTDNPNQLLFDYTDPDKSKQVSVTQQISQAKEAKNETETNKEK